MNKNYILAFKVGYPVAHAFHCNPFFIFYVFLLSPIAIDEI